MPPVKVHVQDESGVDYWLDFNNLETAKATIDRLLKEGYKPVTSAPPASNGHGQGQAHPEASHGPRASAHGQGVEAPPMCAKHGKKLKRRVRYNEEWHSHRIEADGRVLWCRGHASGRPDDGFLVC